MAEDWTSIAAEVDEAIRSVGSTDDGYAVTLRKISTSGGSIYDPAAGTTTPGYTTMRVIESETRERDRQGNLVGTKRRTLTVAAVYGVVPQKADKIALGMTKAEVEAAGDTAVEWQEIDEVYPLSPAGMAVLYEIDLVI